MVAKLVAWTEDYLVDLVVDLLVVKKAAAMVGRMAVHSVVPLVVEMASYSIERTVEQTDS